MRQRESGAEGSPYGRGFRSRNRITGKEKVFGRSFDTVTLCEPEPGTPPPPYPQTTTRLPQPALQLSVPCASTGQSLFQLPKGLASAPAITARERPDLTPLPHTPCRHGVRKETLQVDQPLWLSFIHPFTKLVLSAKDPLGAGAKLAGAENNKTKPWRIPTNPGPGVGSSPHPQPTSSSTQHPPLRPSTSTLFAFLSADSGRPHTLDSCHHCPATNKQPSQSTPAKGPRWLPGGCQFLMTKPETKGEKTFPLIAGKPKDLEGRPHDTSHTRKAERPQREGKMSESSSKSSQPLASKQEKDGTEKRGRGRPRKQPPKEPSEVPTPKRPRGRPKGSKNKGAAKTREKEEEEGISQESSEEEQ
ncbi:hypothetical protein PANDA_002251 [Ailuropoda melanoleuca]|uniref:High mobility group protein HMG-I/HMG-Y n=4 Tax=Boreoeutheria TaxID=1437010 RepID=D2GYY3_AILME|nr:hypothetical protein PANDA_002251 [Ailuropoda melanoleuca]